MNNKLNNLKIKINGQEYEFQGGSGGKLFEDVTELPSTLNENVIYRVNSDNGQPVPNSGYVDKVYLNTDLTDEEIEKILDEAFPSQDAAIYPMLYAGVDKAIFIMRSYEEDTEKYANAIVGMNMEPIYWINKAMLEKFNADVEKSGWQQFSNPIIINAEVSNVDNTNAAVGELNDKLIELFYIGTKKETKYFVKDGKEIKEFVFKDNVPAIKFVDKLPVNPNPDAIYGVGQRGTVVPNTGFINKIYLNTSLTDEEINEICNNITLTGQGLMEVVLSVPLELAICILSVDAYAPGMGLTGYAIANMFSEEIYYVSPQNVSLEELQNTGTPVTFFGWNPNFNGEIEINHEVWADLGDDNSIPSGTQNDKLTDLLSLTPSFGTDGIKYVNVKDGVEFEFVDKNSIAKIKDGTLFFDDKSVNSALPNTEYVDNIYFNTELSAEEVTIILDKIPDSAYSEFLDDSVVYVLAYHIISYSDPYCVRSLIVGKLNESRYQIIYAGDTSNSDTVSAIFDSAIGWKEDFNGTIDFNGNALAFADGYSNIGTHNDILTNLVYVKPKQEAIKKIQYQGKSYVLSPFEDVKELPSNPNTGTIYRVKQTLTPVPNDGGIIETVHFNTKLTTEEVVQKVNSLDLPWVDASALGWSALEVYPICVFDGSNMAEFNNDPYVALIFARDKADYNGVIITFARFATGGYTDVFISDSGSWKGITSQVINLNGITEFQGIPIGTHNELITDIVSTTDFNQKAKYYNYDGTKLNNINTKEEYVIEFEYDKYKYNDDEEFKKQVIEPYQLPIDILKKFPNEIDIVIRIKYTNNNIKGYTAYENYKVREYHTIMTDGTGHILKFIYPDAHQVKRIELGVYFTENGTVYLNGFYIDNINSGSSSTVDTAMSDSSTNPVQNKVIKEYVDNKAYLVPTVLTNLDEETGTLSAEDLNKVINDVNTVFIELTENEQNNVYILIGETASTRTYGNFQGNIIYKIIVDMSNGQWQRSTLDIVDKNELDKYFTAGEGLKIENGVISLTYANGDEEEF